MPRKKKEVEVVKESIIEPQGEDLQVSDEVEQPIVVVKKMKKVRIKKPKLTIKVKKEKKSKEEVKKERKKNPWLDHVKTVRAKNTDMAYKDVLKLASASYKKS